MSFCSEPELALLKARPGHPTVNRAHWPQLTKFRGPAPHPSYKQEKGPHSRPVGFFRNVNKGRSCPRTNGRSSLRPAQTQKHPRPTELRPVRGQQGRDCLLQKEPGSLPGAAWLSGRFLSPAWDPLPGPRRQEGALSPLSPD